MYIVVEMNCVHFLYSIHIFMTDFMNENDAMYECISKLPVHLRLSFLVLVVVVDDTLLPL